jgi:hypothetical protein
MKDVITAAPTVTKPRTSPALTPADRVRRIGLVLLGIQFGGFLVWSMVLYSHFDLAQDFSLNYQAWFLIAHGNLDPFSSAMQISYWRIHSEFVMWPLALLYWVWPHGVTLLWVQDLAIAGAEAVAFTWLCEVARRHRPGVEAVWLTSAGLVLIVANPWIWWSVTKDFHTESVATLFAVLLARDLSKGRRRTWVWVVPLIFCGDVASTYLAGIGFGAMLAGRPSRALGATLTVAGVVTTLLITLVHGNLGSGHGLQGYGYLAGPSLAHTSTGLGGMALGIISHPFRLLGPLWRQQIDLWANLAPAGLVGIGEPAVLPLVVVVSLANSLLGPGFIEPSFQTLPVYVLLPVGTVAVLGRLARRRRRTARLLAGLLVVQAVGWAVAWVPKLPDQWLRVPAPTATVLARLESHIPESAEVIASQGVVGRFGARARVLPLLWRYPNVPVGPGEIWVVIAPVAGVEVQSTASAAALIAELAGPLHATLVTHSSGVWAFRWRPPPGVHTLPVPNGLSPLRAWAAPIGSGTVGRTVMNGPVRNWHVTSTGGKGYVSDGLAWQEPPGQYKALVRLSTNGPVNIEVWNDTGNVLLARRTIPATTGTETLAMPVNATTAYLADEYMGWGPFRAKFTLPPPGNRLEVRIWSPGGPTVNVYGAKLIHIAAPPATGARP